MSHYKVYVEYAGNITLQKVFGHKDRAIEWAKMLKAYYTKVFVVKITEETIFEA